MKKQTKVLATSIATIAMCASLAVGGTFALFTSEDEVNIAVTAGTVKIEATAKDLDQSDLWAGQAAINGGTVSIENMLPGDSVTFKVDVTNYSTVPAHYRTVLTSEDGGLADALTISFDKATTQAPISFLGGYGVDNWKLLEAAAEGGEVVETITVTIAFNAQGDEIDNLYQSKDCSYKVYVEAVQGNAEVIDPIKQVSDNTYEIWSEEGMRLMTGIANASEPGAENYLYFNLKTDLDMSGYKYVPTSRWFTRFDGEGHSISNLTATENERYEAGLFGYGVDVQNVTLRDMTVIGERAALILGQSEGHWLKNITIEGNNTVTYQTADDAKLNKAAIGALVGLNYGLGEVSNVKIADNATITLNYNGMNTEHEYFDGDRFGGYFGDTDKGSPETYPTTGIEMSDSATIVKNGEWWYLVSDAASLRNGVSKGYNVKMMNNIELDADAGAPYGNNYGIAQNGGVLDGNGNSLTIEGTLDSDGKADDYAIMTSGGTIKDLKLGNCFRAVMIMNPQSNVVLDNVEIVDSKVCYTINTGEVDEEKNIQLTAKDCKIGGWTSFAGISLATFENCDFVQGEYTTNDSGRLVKPYVNTTFTDCRFVEDMYLDCSMFEGDDAIRFTDCEMEDGTAITADNLMVLFNSGVYEKDGVPHNDWKVGGVATADFVPVYVDDVKAVGMTYIADGFYQLEDGSYVVLNADGLRNFAKSVNEGLEGLNEGAAKNYLGETVKLTADIDLENKAWTPIGTDGDQQNGTAFYGTFDGNNKTISNLYINLSTRAYQAAGLFGAVRNGVVKDLKIVNANVYALDDAGDTDNGIAVVVGCAPYGATIDNVDVTNAVVRGNRKAGVISGYFAGTIKNCDVIDAEITIVPDLLTSGSYDNGDKAGGIVAYINTSDDFKNEITDNTVTGAKLKAYRDIGGIVGGGYPNTVKGNTAKNISIIVDQVTGNYGDKDANADHIVGRNLSNANLDDNEVKGTNSIVYTQTVAEQTVLDNALSNTNTNKVVDVVLSTGEYKLEPNSAKTITITGTEDVVIDATGNDKYALSGSEVVFNGVTIKGGTGYNGFTHYTKIVYNNCVIEGQLYLYGETVFNECTFNLPQGCYIYSWGAKNLTITNCVFNTAGKALIIYGEDNQSTVTVTGTEFKSKASDKAGAVANQSCAAIEIDNGDSTTKPTHTLITSGNTIDSKFSGEWRIKRIVADSYITVNGVVYNGVDGNEVWLDGVKYVKDASNNVTKAETDAE